MRLKSFGSTTIEEIYKLEEEYDLKLPEVYVDFLLKTNGGVVDFESDNAIVIPGLDKSVQMEIYYGINLEEDCFNVYYWMKRYKSELPDNSIIIGDDQLKGFLVLICSGYNMGLYYWDDKYNFEESNDEGNAYKIADNFELLNIILNIE